MKKGYKDLLAWQRGMELAVAVYEATRELPKDEIYGLTGQMRRAAVSIPSNIAEGQGRNSPGEFRQFLGQTKGSLLELETQVELCVRLNFVRDDTINASSTAIKRDRAPA